jgi:hypothetical protein
MNTMYKDKRKLHTALIEIGKEVEGMKQVPGADDIHAACATFKMAIHEDNMKEMRTYGRKLTSLLIKFMIEIL